MSYANTGRDGPPLNDRYADVQDKQDKADFALASFYARKIAKWLTVAILTLLVLFELIQRLSG
jgi:hypothetical protein